MCSDSANIGNILDMTYGFGLGTSDNGNFLSIANNRDSTRSINYSYDTLNRILTAETTSTFATSPTHCWAETYQYDNQSTGGPWGNLTSISALTGTYTGCTQESGFAVTAMPNNQFSPANGYDAAGNMTSAGATSYTYDAENHLLTTAGITYTYDGDGQRVLESGVFDTRPNGLLF